VIDKIGVRSFSDITTICNNLKNTELLVINDFEIPWVFPKPNKFPKVPKMRKKKGEDDDEEEEEEEEEDDEEES